MPLTGEIWWRFLVPLIGFACSFAIAPSASSASATKITGVVLDQDGIPLATAAIGCTAEGRMLTRGAEPVDLSGRFDVQVAGGVTHMTCTFSASGYQTRTRTAAVQNGQVDMQDIRLDKLERLIASSLIKNLTPDGQYLIVDMIVSNPSSQAVDIVGVQVNGAALLSTSCFDPRPAVILKIDDHVPMRRLKDSEVELQATVELPPTNWSESVTARGRIERLGCQQERLTLDISYLVQFNPGDHEKLRIALPQHLSVGDSRPAPIDLASWQALQVSLKLADGTSVQASLR